VRTFPPAVRACQGDLNLCSSDWVCALVGFIQRDECVEDQFVHKRADYALT